MKIKVLARAMSAHIKDTIVTNLCISTVTLSVSMFAVHMVKTSFDVESALGFKGMYVGQEQQVLISIFALGFMLSMMEAIVDFYRATDTLIVQGESAVGSVQVVGVVEEVENNQDSE